MTKRHASTGRLPWPPPAGNCGNFTHQSKIDGILGAIAREDNSVIPLLVDLLRGDSVSSYYAAEALAAAGPKAKSAIPELVKLVGTNRTIFNPFVAIDPKGTTAIPLLSKKLKDADPLVRAEAARMLGDYKGNAKLAITSLIAATEDSDAQVRAWTVLSLGSVGPDAKAAVPRLVALLKDKAEVGLAVIEYRNGGVLQIRVPTVAIAAARSLNRIDPEAARKANVAGDR